MTVYDVELFSDHGAEFTNDVHSVKQKETFQCAIFNDNLPAKHDEVNRLCYYLSSVDMSDVHSDPKYRHDFKEYTFNNVYSQDDDGDTLLHAAIIVLNDNIAELLINLAPSFESLNIKNRLRQTPLHLAVLTKQSRIVRRLMVGGADIMSRNRIGYTPLHIACREGYTEIVRILLEPVRYRETKLNEYDIPYQRIPQNLGKTNFDGVSCLHIAASNGHLEIVKLLLEKNADINCKDVKSGRTPLHHASADGHVELVQLLLTYKTCNINARAYDYVTPFDLARDRGHARITFELASAGAKAADEIDMEDI